MPPKLKFICETCRNFNKHRRESQPVIETEYMVFSEAVEHLVYQREQYGESHYMDVVIEESDDRN